MPAGDVSITANYTQIVLVERQSISDTSENTGLDYEGARQVDFSSDGNTIAVSMPAPGNYTNNDLGRVEIYTRNDASSAWTAKGSPIDGASLSELSRSISLSGDGNTVVIGGQWSDYNGTNSGHIRVYKWNSATSEWDQMGQRINGIAQYSRFGRSVAISGNGLIIASGGYTYNSSNTHVNLGYFQVFEWNNATSQWDQRGSTVYGPSANSEYGWDVELNNDGSILLNHTGASVINVFEWGGSNYTQKGSNLSVSSSGYISDGKSCAISSDGLTIAFTIAAKVFEWSALNSDWVQVGSTFSFGDSISLSSDGTVLGISEADYDSWKGAIHIYKLESGAWVFKDRIIGSGSAQAEALNSFTISPDGSNLAIIVKSEAKIKTYTIN